MPRAGIVSWGVYIPRFRIRTEEIARLWGDDPMRIKDLYLVEEKSVAGIDEDSATMAVEASLNAIRRGNVNPREIGAVYVGSESKPYAVKPTASILVDALGIQNNAAVVDMEFACKAGAEGMLAALGLVESGRARYGLAVGTDTAQGEPGEHLDYTTSSGAAAYVMGIDGVAVEVEAAYSYNSDTPDFWRREGSPYPVHGEGFTGEPAYFRHIGEAVKGLMSTYGYKADDFSYVVFHQPNTRFPLRMASTLGFPMDKVKPGLVVTHIGNTYNAAALIGLARILDSVAKPGDRILLAPFGSGAGSIAFALHVTDVIEERRGVDVPTVEEYLDNKVYIDYATYLKLRGMVKLLE